MHVMASCFPSTMARPGPLMLTWPFLTASVRFSRMISCLYPPNPLGFCLSHLEVPGNSHCLSWDPLESSSPDERVVNFCISERYLAEVVRTNCQERWDDWGWGAQVFIALDPGRTCRWIGQRCGSGDGVSVTWREVREMIEVTIIMVTIIIIVVTAGVVLQP